ncbi:MAG: 50S ribosomal protein L22 [Myxococcota bacterium]
MEARASLRYVRMAPRKIRTVLGAIRNQPVELALAQLRFTDRAAAGVIGKLLASAVANVQDRYGDVDTSGLFVKAAYADQGPTLKRFMPRAHGRAARINKKTSHVTVVVAGEE